MVKDMSIEYMCTYCGKRELRGDKAGRPSPGKCPRKKNGGPHSWVKNKKFQGKEVGIRPNIFYANILRNLYRRFKNRILGMCLKYVQVIL